MIRLEKGTRAYWSLIEHLTLRSSQLVLEGIVEGDPAPDMRKFQLDYATHVDDHPLDITPDVLSELIKAYKGRNLIQKIFGREKAPVDLEHKTRFQKPQPGLFIHLDRLRGLKKYCLNRAFLPSLWNSYGSNRGYHSSEDEDIALKFFGVVDEVAKLFEGYVVLDALEALHRRTISNPVKDYDAPLNPLENLDFRPLGPAYQGNMGMQFRNTEPTLKLYCHVKKLMDDPGTKKVVAQILVNYILTHHFYPGGRAQNIADLRDTTPLQDTGVDERLEYSDDPDKWLKTHDEIRQGFREVLLPPEEIYDTLGYARQLVCGRIPDVNQRLEEVIAGHNDTAVKYGFPELQLNPNP